MKTITKEQKQLVTLYAVGTQIWAGTNDLKNSSIIEKIALTFAHGILKTVLDSTLKSLEEGLTDEEWRELLNDLKNKAS